MCVWIDTDVCLDTCNYTSVQNLCMSMCVSMAYMPTRIYAILVLLDFESVFGAARVSKANCRQNPGRPAWSGVRLFEHLSTQRRHFGFPVAHSVQLARQSYTLPCDTLAPTHGPYLARCGADVHRGAALLLLPRLGEIGCD